MLNVDISTKMMLSLNRRRYCSRFEKADYIALIAGSDVVFALATTISKGIDAYQWTDLDIDQFVDIWSSIS
jgi:hypothetical protein